MKFLLSKWVEKTAKAIGAAILTAVLGPRVQPILGSLGVTIDPLQFQTGFFAVLLSLGNWLKHQVWTPKVLQKLL